VVRVANQVAALAKRSQAVRCAVLWDVAQVGDREDHPRAGCRMRFAIGRAAVGKRRRALTSIPGALPDCDGNALPVARIAGSILWSNRHQVDPLVGCAASALCFLYEPSQLKNACRHASIH
jgi:hypothetical protein